MVAMERIVVLVLYYFEIEIFENSRLKNEESKCENLFPTKFGFC